MWAPGLRASLGPATPVLSHTSTLSLLNRVLLSPFNSQRADASTEKCLCPVGYYITIATDKYGGGTAQGMESHLSHRGFELSKGQFQCEPVLLRSVVGCGALLDCYLYGYQLTPLRLSFLIQEWASTRYSQVKMLTG